MSSSTTATQAIEEQKTLVADRMRFLEKASVDAKVLYGWANFPTVGTVPPRMLSITESCVFKSALAGTAGAGLGALLGLFMTSYSHSLAYDPLSQRMSSGDQLKLGWRQMRTACVSSARNFGSFGVLYSMTECMLEKHRATRDMKNAVYAGALTGGLMAIRGGPVATVMGAAGVGILSAGIEYYQAHYSASATGASS